MTPGLDPSALVGTRIGGRYTLTRELGRGGTAVVWLADDAATGSQCAVKLLSAKFAARADLRKRFHNEAQAMASIRHPNVLKLFGWGVGSDGPWMVTEYVPGGSIASWVRRRGPMPPRMAIGVALQVCDALVAAHAAGVVHRDVKPDNVLIAAGGAIRVSDFGIAQVARAEERITRTGTSIGTLGYMAPEQIQDARDVDERADIYGVATTLWFLLCGRVPPHAFHADPYSSGIPGPLCPLISLATAFRRDDRPADIGALRIGLEGIWEQLPELPEGTPALFQCEDASSASTLDPTASSSSEEPEVTWVESRES